ncbi:kinase-like domain-containing protein [Aspergillus carlsbadensis]|nr:kinase-like domain-containing protein [Aspergillus carlsbadensis]
MASLCGQLRHIGYRRGSAKPNTAVFGPQMRFVSYFWPGARQATATPDPEIYLEKQSGLEQRISEQDLYRYIRHRWLFNEKRELSKRYLKYNLPELLNVAVNVCDGARYCTKITKCAEGLHNKGFILTMDNGSEVFAKLPNPNAGPARFSVASEVATREMLRDVFELPVPRVLAWSSDSSNTPVEAEYIIEEKAPGVRLGSVWNEWPRELKLQIIVQVAELENKLTTVSFDRHGCIYFKEDLRALVGEAEDIHTANLEPGVLERFAIGPLTTNELWRDARKVMELDRGPWKDATEYNQAIGRNEIAWIKKHATPRTNHYQPKPDQELPEDGISLLEKYMQVSSHLVPQPGDGPSSANVLWHPDLHLDNIFVDPETHRITRIVDWQSARVAPLFYQVDVPRLCRHTGPVRKGWVIPERPADFDRLPQDEQNRIDDALESETLHKYYEAQVYKRAPLHWAVHAHRAIPILRKPVWLVSGVWENRDLFFLREALMDITARWSEFFPGIACPIGFSSEDIERHSKEEENVRGVGEMMAMFRREAVLPVDGMVDPDEYELACANNRKFKEAFIGLAQDDEERELFRNLWPYQEPVAT